MYLFELILLAVIVLVVAWAIRGKPAQPEPVVIVVPGQRHITLAPQLQAARAYIETVAAQFGPIVPDTQDSAICHFIVHDAPRAGSYLLAVSLRARMLYFQAILPAAHGAHLANIAAYAAQVMERLPCTGVADAAVERRLAAAVRAAALACHVGVERLDEK